MAFAVKIITHYTSSPAVEDLAKVQEGDVVENLHFY
jgi:hypothetical protein